MINLFWSIPQRFFHNAIAWPELNFIFKTKITSRSVDSCSDENYSADIAPTTLALPTIAPKIMSTPTIAPHEAISAPVTNAPRSTLAPPTVATPKLLRQQLVLKKKSPMEDKCTFGSESNVIVGGVFVFNGALFGRSKCQRSKYRRIKCSRSKIVGVTVVRRAFVTGAFILVCKQKRVKTRHITHINLGLSTNLVCEFGPFSLTFQLEIKKKNGSNLTCPMNNCWPVQDPIIVIPFKQRNPRG